MGFTNYSELKVLKYLAVIGIKALENDKNANISFNDLRKKASKKTPFDFIIIVESISKTHKKMDKSVNHELRIIKTELAKLSQKFEEKLQ